MHVKGSLVVRANAMDQAFYEAKWRDENGRQVKRRLGAAWLERTDAGGWIQPSGRVPSGLLSRDDALLAMRDAIAVWQGEQAMARARESASITVTTFAEAAHEWLCRAERRRKLSTVKDYSYTIGVYLSATSTGSSRLGIGPAPFATLPLRELATNEGASVVAAWFDGMEPATSRTRSKLEMMTVSIFKYAIAQGWISVNPMDRVDRHHVSYDASKYDWYSSGEVRRLIQSAGNERDGLIYATMAYSGVRIGEALALEWGRIDFEARRISVTQNLSYGAIGTTKGGRGRTIPLVNQLETLLRAYRPSQGGGLVFPGEVKYLDPSTLRRRYATDVRRAGLRHLPMHSLRHYFASTAVNVASLVQVRDWLGHSDMRTVTSRYLHSKSLVTDADTLGAGF